MRRISCAAVAALAALLVIAPSAPAAPRACAAAGALPGSAAQPALRGAMRCVLNAERARRGLAPLRVHAGLDRAAAGHARDMVARGYFAHERAGSTLAGRLRAAGWSGGAAEAIGWGCGPKATPRSILRGWLASPPHRAIVLGSYRRTGIGLAPGAPGSGCGPAATWVLDVGS